MGVTCIEGGYHGLTAVGDSFYRSEEIPLGSSFKCGCLGPKVFVNNR